MRFGLGSTISRIASRATVALKTYIKSNLKLYFDFASTRAKTLEFVGTGSASFNSADSSKVVVDDDDSLDVGTESFTIAAWMYSESSATFYIAGKNTNVTDGFPGWRFMQHQTEDVLFFKIIDASEDNFYIYGNKVLEQNRWYHLAGVVDRVREKIYIYIDGIKDSTTDYNTFSNVGTLDNTGDFIIGTRYDDGGNKFTGNMKNVGYWKRALSNEEIRTIMYKNYSDLAGSELTHLLGWWALEGDATDSAENNNGAASNISWNTTNYGNGAPRKPRGFDNAPEAQADLIGSGSASFNGVSGEDAINCGATSNIIKSNNTTYVCWVKRTANTRSYAMSGQKSGGGSLLSLAINSRTTGEDAGEITVALYDGGSLGYANTEATVLTKNKWHHIAAVVTDGSQKIYVDGVLVGSGTLDFDASSPGSESFTIGSYDAGDQLNIPANMAQVGVFNEALTQEQIQSISQKTYDDLSSSETANLTSWWALDEQTATDGTAGTGGVKDSHGTNHGTLI